MSFVTLLRPPT